MNIDNRIDVNELCNAMKKLVNGNSDDVVSRLLRTMSVFYFAKKDIRLITDCVAGVVGRGCLVICYRRHERFCVGMPAELAVVRRAAADCGCGVMCTELVVKEGLPIFSAKKSSLKQSMLPFTRKNKRPIVNDETEVDKSLTRTVVVNTMILEKRHKNNNVGEHDDPMNYFVTGKIPLALINSRTAINSKNDSAIDTNNDTDNDTENDLYIDTDRPAFNDSENDSDNDTDRGRDDMINENGTVGSQTNMLDDDYFDDIFFVGEIGLKRRTCWCVVSSLSKKLNVLFLSTKNVCVITNYVAAGVGRCCLVVHFGVRELYIVGMPDDLFRVVSAVEGLDCGILFSEMVFVEDSPCLTYFVASLGTIFDGVPLDVAECVRVLTPIVCPLVGTGRLGSSSILDMNGFVGDLATAYSIEMSKGRLCHDQVEVGVDVLAEHILSTLRRMLPVGFSLPTIKVVAVRRFGVLTARFVCGRVYCDSRVVAMPLVAFEVSRLFMIDNLVWLENNKDCWTTDEGRFRVRALMLGSKETVKVCDDDTGDLVYAAVDDGPFNERVYHDVEYCHAIPCFGSSSDELYVCGDFCGGRTTGLVGVPSVSEYCVARWCSFGVCLWGGLFFNRFAVGDTSSYLSRPGLVQENENDLLQRVVLTAVMPTNAYPNSVLWWRDSSRVYNRVSRCLPWPPPIVNVGGCRKRSPFACVPIEKMDSLEWNTLVNGADGLLKAFSACKPGENLYHCETHDNPPSALVCEGGYICFTCNRAYQVGFRNNVVPASPNLALHEESTDGSLLIVTLTGLKSFVRYEEYRKTDCVFRGSPFHVGGRCNLGSTFRSVAGVTKTLKEFEYGEMLYHCEKNFPTGLVLDGVFLCFGCQHIIQFKFDEAVSGLVKSWTQSVCVHTWDFMHTSVLDRPYFHNADMAVVDVVGDVDEGETEYDGRAELCFRNESSLTRRLKSDEELDDDDDEIVFPCNQERMHRRIIKETKRTPTKVDLIAATDRLLGHITDMDVVTVNQFFMTLRNNNGFKLNKALKTIVRERVAANNSTSDAGH